MTKDEIIAMAKEAGFNWPEILTTTIEERLERFYNLAYTKGVQDERKAIAQMENHMTTQQTEALQLEQVIKERDEAEDYIDALLDEVLGIDRREWSSAYGRNDALVEVRDRIAALHAPQVDRAWQRFEHAIAAAPQLPVASSEGGCDAR